MNELITVKGIFRLLEIFLKLSPSFQSLTISAFCELFNSLPLAMIRTFSYDKQLQKVSVRILRLTIKSKSKVGNCSQG